MSWDIFWSVCCFGGEALLMQAWKFCIYVIALEILKIFINLLLSKVFRSRWTIGNRSFWLVSNLYLLNGMFRHLLAVPPCPACSIGEEHYLYLVDYLTNWLSDWKYLLYVSAG